MKRNTHATTWMNLESCQVREACHKEPHTTSLHLMKRPEQTEGRPTAGWE